MAIRESLELELSQALAGADRIGEALSAAVSGFRSELSDALSASSVVSISADTSEIPAGIEEATASAEAVVAVSGDAGGVADSIDQAVFDADATVPVDADTSEIPPAIEDAVNSVSPTITPEVDTAAASGELGALGQTADQVSGQLGKAGGQLSSFGANATTSATSIGALTGSITSMASSVPILGGVAAALAGVIAFSDKAFQSAVNVQAGVLRETQVFGQFKGQIENIKVGNLDSSLKDLNMTLGSSTTATRQSAATLGQLAVNSGASQQAAAGFAAQVVALSANAVALNPALGEVGDVTDRMGLALSRGGRFAAKLGISLTAAEISQRALRDTGKSTAAQLTLFEKQAAGAALATDKYGDSLRKNLAQAAQNPVIQLKQLEAQTKAVIAQVGAPLVAPIFDILRSAQPAIGATVQVLGALGKATLPAIAEAARASAPGIVAMADAIAQVAPVLTPVLTELTRFASLFGIFAVLGSAQKALGITSSDSASSQNQLQQSLIGSASASEQAKAAVAGTSEEYSKLQTALLGVKDAETGYGDALAGIDAAQKGAETAARAVTDAHKEQTRAARAVADAQRGVTDAQQAAVDAQRTYEASLRSVVDAERQRQTALRSSADAQLELEQAQRALAEAQEGTSSRDQLAIDQARLDLQEAQEKATASATDATATLTDKEQDRISAARAALDLQDAQARAASRVTDAQGAVVSAQQRLIDTQLAVERADQGVTDAHEGVASAARHSADAQRGIADAQQRVLDAQDGVTNAAVRVRDAENQAAEATDKVAGARDRAARAAIALSDARSGFAAAEGDETQNAEALIGHLEDLKTQFPEVAPALQPLIDKFNELKETVPPEAGAATGQAFTDGMTGAIGGSGPQLQTATSQGFAGIDFQGLADQFRAGLGIVGTTISEKAIEFKDNVLGWVNTAAAEAPTRLAFLSGEFAGWATREVLAMPGRVDALKDNVLGWIGTAITEAPGKLLGLTTAFQEWAGGVPGAVVGAIGDVNRLLLNKGKDLIRGLFQGIVDVVNQLPGFLGPIKDQFIEGFRNAFDSHSPARVMEPIGRDIVGGVLVSMQGEGAAVVAAAEQIARDAANALVPNPSTSLGLSTIAGAVTGGGVAAGGGVVIQSVTVNATLPAGTTPEQARALGDSLGVGFVDRVRTAVLTS